MAGRICGEHYVEQQLCKQISHGREQLSLSWSPVKHHKSQISRKTQQKLVKPHTIGCAESPVQVQKEKWVSNKIPGTPICSIRFTPHILSYTCIFSENQETHEKSNPVRRLG